MQTKKIKGIIVSKTSYAENDEMLNVLTKDSFINIYAKGVKKTESKNRINIPRGAFVDFEIFNEYATPNSVLLKKAVLIQGLPSVTKTNASKIELFLKIVKHIKDSGSGLYETYVELINDFEGENFFKNQTFLISQILYSFGEGLAFSNCVHCGSNQNLLGFDISEGGMLCKIHTKIKTPLLLLKSLFLLGESREKYVAGTSAEVNKQVFQLLSNLLF